MRLRRIVLSAGLLVAMAAAALAAGLDGAWHGEGDQWTLHLTIRGEAVSGRASYGRFSWTVTATVDGQGRVRGTLIPASRMQQDRTLEGVLPNLSISAGNAWSEGGSVKMRQDP